MSESETTEQLLKRTRSFRFSAACFGILAAVGLALAANATFRGPPSSTLFGNSWLVYLWPFSQELLRYLPLLLLAAATLYCLWLYQLFGQVRALLEGERTPRWTHLIALRLLRALSSLLLVVGSVLAIFHFLAALFRGEALFNVSVVLSLILAGFGSLAQEYFADVIGRLKRPALPEPRPSVHPELRTPSETAHYAVGARSAARAPRPKVDVHAWDKLVLPPELLDELKGMVEVIRDVPGFRRKWGAEPPLGIILVGPPGNGKTEIAKAFAKAGGYSFFRVSGADIRQSNAYGAAENAIRETYEEARAAAPSVVFIDEIDSIAAKRRANPYDGASSEDNHVVTQLLQDIQGFEMSEQFVFTIGATNHLEALDPAVTSRLRQHLFIGNPDREARLRMLETFTRELSSRGRLKANLEAVADVSEGFSGRDLTNVVSQAVMAANREHGDAVTTRHLLEAAWQIARDVAPTGD